MKLAYRVEQTLKDDVLFDEPKQINPVLILVGLWNRGGAPPNVLHLHMVILKSFKTKGFDRTRAAIGICIKYTSELGKRMLLEHNHRFSRGNRLLPPIDDERALYGSVACTHYNLALRVLQCCTDSPLGNLSDLVDENPHLKDAVHHGHRWWVLPETVCVDRQVDISLWRNMDQNENQGTHEVEHLQQIKGTAEDLSTKQSKVTLANLVATTVRRNPAKVSSNAMQHLSKFYIGFLENGVVGLVQEIVDFHSQLVDPQEISVSIAFFQFLVSEEARLSQCPYTRMYLLLTQYTPEKVRVQAGGPGVCQFLETTVLLTGLCKKTETLNLLETKIKETRAKYLPILEQSLSQCEARLEIQVYIDLIIRCLLNKPWPPSLNPKVTLPVGKFSVEKVESLAVPWARAVDKKHPHLNFAEASGLKEQAPVAEKEESLMREIDRSVQRADSDPATGPEMSPSFSRGDEVTVIRRMTWALPLPESPDYRKNIVEGTSGTIEGWADVEKGQVLLKVVLDLPSGPGQSITKPVFPRNLKLTRDLQEEDITWQFPKRRKITHHTSPGEQQGPEG